MPWQQGLAAQSGTGGPAGRPRFPAPVRPSFLWSGGAKARRKEKRVLGGPSLRSYRRHRARAQPRRAAGGARPQAGPFPKLPAAIFGNRAVRQIGGRFLATLVASFIFFLEGGDVFYLKFSFRILNGMRLKVGFGEASVNECRAGSCLLLYVVRNSGTQGLGASRACRSI